MISYKEFNSELLEEVKKIYEDDEWISYLTDDDKLMRAFNNSLYLFGAFDDGKLVGFARCVGDGEHIVIVQDLIVLKAYQKCGIGTSLFKSIWNKYINVRMFVVLTDLSNEASNRFYKSFGMKRLEEGDMVSYYR